MSISKPIFLLIILMGIICKLQAQQTDTGGENMRPKVGLVLSGGSAKGIAHIGALKVIEEAGLPIDYIGGTSMGSIIGGLYAIGYDADSLEKIANAEDWNRFITDDIPRRDLSIEEKPDADRYYVTFPIRERRVQLPAGVIPGQNVENLLNLLCAHVYNVRDFNDFPIPYLCVAADITTGEEVVFREGYLPQAIRASMAIPTIFNPIMIDGRLLVDGGLTNNFPVANVKEMGADIIIGVNVSMSYYTKEEITDLFKIMEQAVFMHAKESNEKNMALCDILIDPDTEGYGLQSFSAVDSLIARGYNAAKPYLPRLKALADSLNSIQHVPFKKPSFEPLDSILIKDIEIHGIEKVSEKLVTGQLRLEASKKYTPGDLYKSFEHAYTSLYFNKIGYELMPVQENGPGHEASIPVPDETSIPVPDEASILVNVDEEAGGFFRVGLNYNNEYRATISLNATFRNFLVNGSKLSFNASLGENPVLMASYFKNNGWKPGIGLDVTGQNFNVNIYENDHKESIIDYTDFDARLYTRSIISNSYSFGVGLEYEYLLLRPKVGSTILPDDANYNLYNLCGFIDFDTYDHLFYPTRGARFHSEYKFIYNAIPGPIHFLTFKFEKAIKIGQKLVLRPGLSGGMSTSDSTFPGYYFYMGGLNNADRKGLLPFVGLDLTEKISRNVAILRLDLQYNVWKQNYIAIRTNIGNASWTLADQVADPDLFYGAGLTLGNNSLIGPVEITFMSSNLRDELLFYLHLGYWF